MLQEDTIDLLYSKEGLGALPDFKLKSLESFISVSREQTSEQETYKKFKNLNKKEIENKIIEILKDNKDKFSPFSISSTSSDSDKKLEDELAVHISNWKKNNALGGTSWHHTVSILDYINNCIVVTYVDKIGKMPIGPFKDKNGFSVRRMSTFLKDNKGKSFLRFGLKEFVIYSKKSATSEESF